MFFQGDLLDKSIFLFQSLFMCKYKNIQLASLWWLEIIYINLAH